MGINHYLNFTLTTTTTSTDNTNAHSHVGRTPHLLTHAPPSQPANS